MNDKPPADLSQIEADLAKLPAAKGSDGPVYSSQLEALFDAAKAAVLASADRQILRQRGILIGPAGYAAGEVALPSHWLAGHGRVEWFV